MSRASACMQCNGGTYGQQIRLTSCNNCLAGNYSSEGAIACSACRKGAFSAIEASSTCSNCVAGSYNNKEGSSACLLCPAGTYSTALSAQDIITCKKCPGGTYSTIEGLSVTGGCTKCPPKTTSYPGDTSCSSCPVNSFPDPMTDTCVMCPINSAIRNVTSIKECRCAAGYYTAYNAKIFGGEESYITESGVIYKLHTFSDGQGEFRVVDTVVLTKLCNGMVIEMPFTWYPDYFNHIIDAGAMGCDPPVVLKYPVDVEMDPSMTSSYFQCSACIPGKYSDIDGVGECNTCDSGTYQDLPGRSSCKTCPPGAISNESAALCVLCPPGFFQSGKRCIPCSAGFYTRTSGEVICSRCPPNTWSPDASSTCMACPPWSESTGGKGLAGCVCFEGLYMEQKFGLPSCMQCSRGRYSPRGSNTCLLCPNGTFSDSMAQSTCKK